MISNNHKSPLILLEGIDGSGKSSAYVRLQKVLQAFHANLLVVYTKEPDRNRPIGKEIYQILEGNHPGFKFDQMSSFHMQSFYIEDRVCNYRENIIPSLQNGRCIIQDRGVPSSFCYGADSHKDFYDFMGLHDRVFSASQVPFVWPDMIVVFDVPAELAIARMKKSGKKLDEFETITKLEKVRLNYLEFVRKYSNCVIVDGTSENQEAIFIEMRKHVFPVLGIKEP